MSERRIQSLDRALQLLEALRVAGQPLGLKTLSRQTGINPATAHLLLRTLAAHNYVEQEPVGRAYVLGMAIVDAGQRARMRQPLAVIAEPHARRVHEASMESVFVRVVREGQLYSVLEFESTQTIVVRPERVPFTDLRFGYAFASGKVFLAAMVPSEVTWLLGGPPYQSFTANTSTEPTRIASELEQVRDQGYAVDREEFILGVSCVAVPLRDAGAHVVATMSTWVPSVRATQGWLDELVGLLVKEGAAASSRLRGMGLDTVRQANRSADDLRLTLV